LILLQLAEELENSDSKFKCSLLNGANPKNTELARTIGIHRFPTLVLCNGPDSFKKYGGILREKE
jgi:hypothetical protein